MRDIAVDWLSHWILIAMSAAAGIIWGWGGLVGFLIGWTVVNLVYRLGASNTGSDPK